MLVFGTNVLQAPVIDYQHPRREEATSIGRFRATGPGSLHYVPDPAKPEQVFQAAWQTSVSSVARKGSRCWCSKAGRNLLLPKPVRSRPTRFACICASWRGRAPRAWRSAAAAATRNENCARARSADGHGTRGNRVAAAHGPHAAVVGDVSDSTGGECRAAGAASQWVATAAAPARRPARAAVADSVDCAAVPGTVRRNNRIHIDADQMRLEVLLRGQSAVPPALACDGQYRACARCRWPRPSNSRWKFAAAS